MFTVNYLFEEVSKCNMILFIQSLAQPDLDVVQHINSLFPTEGSLGGLDDTMADLQCQVPPPSSSS